jgi:hypothetical protein
MDKDNRFALLVLGLPVLGLLYCVGIIFVLRSVLFAREHPLVIGFGVMFFPFILAATIWIRASAKAYKKNEFMMKSENQNR